MEKIDFSLFIEIESPKDEEDFLDSNPCTCSDQPWSLKERTIVHQEEGREYFARKVFCNVCGKSDGFYFNAPVNAYAGDESDDQPRELHYLFAHRILPEIFFEDPEGFVSVLKGGDANERLLALWKNYDAEIVKDGGTSIAPVGLQLEIINIKSWEGVVISMPEAKFTIEALFIACMLSDDATQYRYFVYEFTFPDNSKSNDSIAVLCEWLPGKRRRNFERKGSVTKEAFLSLVKEQLDNEEQRVTAGAKSISAPTWDMVEESDPSMRYFGNEAYRHHICLFAFHIAPSICRDPQLDLSDVNAMTQLVKNVWEQLGDICKEKGYSNIQWESMSCDVMQHQSTNLVLFRFPEPLSPPEPYFLALKIGEPDKIYFLEKNTIAQDSALFTSITGGSHGIHGQIDHVDENAFLAAINGIFNKDISKSILPHLAYYAEINSIYERIFPEDDQLVLS